MVAIRKSRKRHNRFSVKLAMAILKAKKGDFGALEELLDAKRKQSASKEPPKKDDNAVFTGSLNGAVISVDFTKVANPRPMRLLWAKQSPRIAIVCLVSAIIILSVIT